MSFRDNALKREPEPSLVLSCADAMAAVLVGSVAADGLLREEESTRLNEALAATRWVRGAGDERVDDVRDRCLELITRCGLRSVLSACASAIPPDLRPTMFALAADLVLADGRLGDRENTFLGTLQNVMGIDDELTRKIVDVMLIKNRASGPPDE